MKSFRQYLEESMAQERIHRNPHPSALKTLAKNSKSRTARFVVDERDDFHAGDAEKHTHSGLAVGLHRGGPMQGFVQHQGEDKYHYNVWGAGTKMSNTLRRFEKYGIEKVSHIDTTGKPILW